MNHFRTIFLKSYKLIVIKSKNTRGKSIKKRKNKKRHTKFRNLGESSDEYPDVRNNEDNCPMLSTS